jgi:hypothetical protein
MDKTSTMLSDDFKALWDADSPVRQLWGALEVFPTALANMAAVQATALQAKSLQQLEDEIKAKSRPMDAIYVDWVNVLWARVVLRTQLKVRDSLTLLFHACNTANAYGTALASRGILEHVALLQYFARRVPWRANALVKKDDLIQFTRDFQRLAFGSRFNWDELLSEAGSLRRLLNSGSWSRPAEERIPALGDLIGALDDELHQRGRLAAKGQIQFSYSVLCDVVHPSWGGDFAYSPAMYREMSTTGKLDSHFKLLVSLFCLPIVDVVRHLIELCEELAKDRIRVVL